MWPLKYIRKYGCDGELFSFEAGRNCPGGEGLYAFSTKKAWQLFYLVARNSSEGGPPPPPVPSPNPPPPPASNPPSHPPSAARLPEYQNMAYQDPQVNSMNLTQQVSNLSNVSAQQQQQTYENLVLLYADLVLPATSTPRARQDTDADEIHQVTLNFSSRTNNTPAPREQSRTDVSPPPTEVTRERDRSTTEPSAAQSTAAAEEHVNYAQLDFVVRAALRKTKEERDEEIRQRMEEEAKEEERRKKEEAEKAAKKKGKKKKRARRNSHQ